MANNIISCLDNDYKGKEKIFTITALLVKFEFILIVVVFLFGNYFGKINLPEDIISLILKMLKAIIASVAIGGVIILSILSGTVDTMQDLQSKRISKKIVRASNDDYFEDMEKRKSHYKLKSRNYIANTSYKRGRKK